MNLDINLLLRFFLNILSQGVVPTLKIIGEAIIISLVIGLIGGIIRSLKIPIINILLGLYISIIRGTPFLVLLFIVYFVLLPFDSPFIAALFSLIIYHGAYYIEIFRSGIQSVSRGQIEAAKSIGMSTVQTMRYIIVPQGILSIIPALIGQGILVIKSTSVTAIIGYTEITRISRNLMTSYFEYTVYILLIAAIFYLILTDSLHRLADMVDSKVQKKLMRE